MKSSVAHNVDVNNSLIDKEQQLQRAAPQPEKICWPEVVCRPGSGASSLSIQHAPGHRQHAKELTLSPFGRHRRLDLYELLSISLSLSLCLLISPLLVRERTRKHWKRQFALRPKLGARLTCKCRFAIISAWLRMVYWSLTQSRPFFIYKFYPHRFASLAMRIIINICVSFVTFLFSPSAIASSSSYSSLFFCLSVCLWLLWFAIALATALTRKNRKITIFFSSSNQIEFIE